MIIIIMEIANGQIPHLPPRTLCLCCLQHLQTNMSHIGLRSVGWKEFTSSGQLTPTRTRTRRRTLFASSMPLRTSRHSRRTMRTIRWTRMHR